MNSEILKMRLNHLSEIGFRLSFFGLIGAIIILLSSFFSMFIVAIVAIVGFLLPFLTLGLLFAVYPNYYNNLSNLLGDSLSIINFFWGLTYYVKYIAVIGIIGSLIGAVTLLHDKTEKHVGKFVFCLISMVLCLFVFVLIMSSAFNQTLS